MQGRRRSCEADQEHRCEGWGGRGSPYARPATRRDSNADGCRRDGQRGSFGGWSRSRSHQTASVATTSQRAKGGATEVEGPCGATVRRCEDAGRAASRTDVEAGWRTHGQAWRSRVAIGRTRWSAPPPGPDGGHGRAPRSGTLRRRRDDSGSRRRARRVDHARRRRDDGQPAQGSSDERADQRRVHDTPGKLWPLAGEDVATCARTGQVGHGEHERRHNDTAGAARHQHRAQDPRGTLWAACRSLRTCAPTRRSRDGVHGPHQRGGQAGHPEIRARSGHKSHAGRRRRCW